MNLGCWKPAGGLGVSIIFRGVNVGPPSGGVVYEASVPIIVKVIQKELFSDELGMHSYACWISTYSQASRKDLLPLCIPTQQNDEALTLTGTKHEQRIRSLKCRELFTGITRDRKRMPSPKYILHVLCIFNYSEAASQ